MVAPPGRFRNHRLLNVTLPLSWFQISVDAKRGYHPESWDGIVKPLSWHPNWHILGHPDPKCWERGMTAHFVSWESWACPVPLDLKPYSPLSLSSYYLLPMTRAMVSLVGLDAFTMVVLKMQLNHSCKHDTGCRNEPFLHLQ